MYNKTCLNPRFLTEQTSTYEQGDVVSAGLIFEHRPNKQAIEPCDVWPKIGQRFVEE